MPEISTTKKLVSYISFVRQTSSRPDYQGFSRQLFEMLVVFIFCRVGPGCYLMAEMGKKEYDWRYKLGFLNGRQYVRRINQINDPKYYPATSNKLIEKAILKNSSIPTPLLLGHLNVVIGRSCDGMELRTCEDLRALIERSHVARLCFKLISGYGGTGFKAAEVIRKDAGIALLDMQEQQVYSVSEYYAALGVADNGDFLVEEYFEQHPGLSKFNPSSVNTLRIMIYQKFGKEPQCLGAYLRIGRENSVIDNGTAGGMGSMIDLSTGNLHAATYSLSPESNFTKHPDTGLLIEGETIPNLSAAIDLACQAVTVFPGIHFAGVDVAIGVNGPVIIELNARADYVGFFRLKLPTRYALSK